MRYANAAVVEIGCSDFLESTSVSPSLFSDAGLRRL
jgi:hypothetical protein